MIVQPAAQPLTRFQWLMWSGQKLNPQAAIYTNAGFGVVERAIDRRCFEQAVRALVQRVDALRTVVADEDGLPVQHVRSELDYTPELLDFSQRPAPRACAEQWADEQARIPLDISSRPFDITLIKLADEEYGLYTNFHHLVSDATSVAILEALLSDYYAQAEAGTLDALPSRPSFADHVRLQHERAQSPLARKAAAFWRETLAGDEDPLRFYGQQPSPGVTPVERVTCSLGSERSARVRALVGERPDLFAATADLSLHHLFAAFTFSFLHHLGDRAGSIALGLPFHNRRDPRQQEMVGCLMQILPLRLDLTPDDTLATLVRKVQNRYFAILRHRDHEVGNPLHKRAYDVEFNFIHRRPPARLFDRPRIGRWLHPGHGVDALCLQVYFDAASESYTCEFDFDVTLFDERRRARAIEQFLCVVDGALARPDQPIGDLSLLSASERQEVLQIARAAQDHAIPAASFDDLFRAQVLAAPEGRMAVTAGETRLSYEALDRRVTCAAARLRARGVGAESLVALLSRRSIDLLTGILAVFRAGGAYTPLDPGHPIDRIFGQLRSSGSRVCVVADEFLSMMTEAKARLCPDDGPAICSLEALTSLDDARDPIDDDGPRLDAHPHPNRLSYVIYTSGSTGTPKGAMVDERGMINHLLAKVRDLRLSSDTILAQTASQCSDISVWQFLAPLLVGGQVSVIDDRTVRDAEALLATVERSGVTVLELVPSQLRALLDAIDTSPDLAPPFEQLRCLMPTGEALEPELARRWFARWPRIPLVNAYGPAECSDDVTHQWMATPPATDHHSVPIGRALPNLRVYLLNERLEPCPVGLVGEIYVGGDGVGRGYLHDPIRTCASFVPNPFAESSASGDRLYRTGDVGRYLPSGELVFLGRRDHQVKIRGFRVEVAEVEAALRAHPAIADLVVTPITGGGTRGTRLAAYCVFTGDAPAAAELRRFVQRTLPAYMVPAAFVPLSSLPLTANGKIARNQLPVPQWTELERDEPGTLPTSATEQRLAAIWSEVLGIEELTVDRNFFELGGDSILLMLIVTRCKRAGLAIDQEDLFRWPTIATLAAHLEAMPTVSSAANAAADAADVEAAPVEFDWSDEERAAIEAALGQR